MEKIFSITLSLFFCFTSFLSCTGSTPSLLTRPTKSTVFFRTTEQDHYFLGTDGKLYMGGIHFESSSDLQQQNSTTALTDKQLSELPDQVKLVITEGNRIDGMYPIHAVAEDIVDYSFDGRTYYLTSNGNLYAVRDDYSTEIGTPILVSENVARIANPNAYPLMFILENGDLIVEDKEWYGRDKFEGAETFVGVSGHKLIKIAENARDAFGYAYTLAYIDAYDQLWVAGYNDFGQLANGKYDEVLTKDYDAKKTAGTPISPDGYSNMKFYKALDNVKDVLVDGSNIFAIRNDNSLWGWGANEFGQVGAGTHGDGDPATRDAVTKPKKILENVVKIEDVSFTHEYVTGSNAFMALTSNGDLYAWGVNTEGVLGNGEYTARHLSSYSIIEEGLFSDKPVLVMKDVKDFSESGIRGNLVFMALKNNGDLYAWGRSALGNVGNGVCVPTYMERGDESIFVPTPTKIMEDVVCIANYNALGAITSDGTVWNWGPNPFGWSVTPGYDTYDPRNINTAIIFATPTKNPYISATIAADGTVSFVPTPVE